MSPTSAECGGSKWRLDDGGHDSNIAEHPSPIVLLSSSRFEKAVLLSAERRPMSSFMVPFPTHRPSFRSLALLAFSLWMAAIAVQADDPAPVRSIFADARLESAVRQQVFAKRWTNSPLTAEDVLHVATVNANGQGITNLSGLEYCRELASADLAGNQIMDLSPISGLRQLQYLNLATNHIQELAPLATNGAIQYLELSHNHITDFSPLRGLSNLANLYLGYNAVRSLNPATNFHRLVSLYLEHNQLTSVAGLEQIPSVNSLSVAHNRVADLTPLQALQSPTFLFLENNDFQDISPLDASLRKDLAGAKRFSPFVHIYVGHNPWNAASRELIKKGKSDGFRYHE